jgi:Tfp pilus assembly major pilin PilA
MDDQIMNTAEQILVIFLSTALAILLVLAIIALALVVSIVKKLNRITAKAESVANSAEAVGNAIQQTASNLRIFSLLRAIVGMAQSKDDARAKRKNKDEEDA